MSWLRRRPERPESTGPLRLESGAHRSPGFATLVQELRSRRLRSILDLGPPSTENVDFLSRFTENLSIQDLYRAAAGEGGPRTVGRQVAVGSLPSPDQGAFDLVLLWDLLHYVERSERSRFCERLAGLCRPGALLLLMASNDAEVPVRPIHFKILAPDRLQYSIDSAQRLAPPRLRTRDVEQLLAAFRPLRSFQLRTGLQEFLLFYEGAKSPLVGMS